MDKKRSLGPSGQAGRNYLDFGAENRGFRQAGAQGGAPASNFMTPRLQRGVPAPNLGFLLIFVLVEEGPE